MSETFLTDTICCNNISLFINNHKTRKQFSFIFCVNAHNSPHQLVSHLIYLVQCVLKSPRFFASFLSVNEITVTHVHPDRFHWHARVIIILSRRCCCRRAPHVCGKFEVRFITIKSLTMQT